MGSWFHPDYSPTHLFNIYYLWQIQITDPRQNSNLGIFIMKPVPIFVPIPDW